MKMRYSIFDLVLLAGSSAVLIALWRSHPAIAILLGTITIPFLIILTLRGRFGSPPKTINIVLIVALNASLVPLYVASLGPLFLIATHPWSRGNSFLQRACIMPYTPVEAYYRWSGKGFRDHDLLDSYIRGWIDYGARPD